MKTTIAILSLVMSLNVFSSEIKAMTDATSATTGVMSLVSMSLSTDFDLGKEAAAVIVRDIQEFDQSGKISPFLAQLIKGTQERHPDQNRAEAIDTLASMAEEILSK